MADLKDCKKYADCDWRKSVGYCPDECNHFKHKDEVIVVRCKDCKHYREGSMWCDLNSGYGSERPNWYPEDFCSYGDKDNA